MQSKKLSERQPASRGLHSYYMNTREYIMLKGEEQQFVEPRELEERLKIRGSDRIQINNFLGAISIATLSVLLSLSKPGTFGWIFAQLAVAIPCFITSSLAYAKMTYRENDEYYIWDNLGWVTHTLGYIMILNALTIMLHQRYTSISWIFIGVTILLFLIYSVLDVLAKRRRLKEKGLKLSFYIVLIFIGAILPILMGWA